MKKILLILFTVVAMVGCGKKEAGTPTEIKTELTISSVVTLGKIPIGQYLGIKVKKSTAASTTDKFDYDVLKDGVSKLSQLNSDADTATLKTKDVLGVGQYTLKVTYRHGEKSTSKTSSFEVIAPDWGLASLADFKSRGKLQPNLYRYACDYIKV